MTRRAIGIYMNPLSQARSFYRRGVRFKANPRDVTYMRALFHEHWPEGLFVDANSDHAWAEILDAADHIVLLYPDAIGVGFAALERHVRTASPDTIEVLNGRGRRFALDPPTRRALRLRRLLSWTMAGEALFAATILLATPALLIWDLARGRR